MTHDEYGHGEPSEADFYEPPEPLVDEATVVRCTNPECDNFSEDHADAMRAGSWWHPRTYTEYQGVPPHGGPVDFHEDGAFNCPECGREGEEV